MARKEEGKATDGLTEAGYLKNKYFLANLFYFYALWVTFWFDIISNVKNKLTKRELEKYENFHLRRPCLFSSELGHDSPEVSASFRVLNRLYFGLTWIDCGSSTGSARQIF